MGELPEQIEAAPAPALDPEPEPEPEPGPAPSPALEPAPEAALAPDEPRWRRAMRGPVPRLVLGAAVLLLAMRVLWVRPVDVELVYDYGPARNELVLAQMEYLEGRDALRRVRFDYGQSGAGRTQVHAVQLPRGDYVVRLQLTFYRQVPAALRGQETRVDDGRPTVTLDRSLRVSGRGQVTIVVAGE